MSSEKPVGNNFVFVAPYNFWTNELTRDLLKCLQLYPMVWDKSHAEFYSSKNQYYEKIGRTLKVRPDWCRMRIDTLRKYFRELKRKSEDQKSKISWPFYKDCQFMSTSAGPLTAQKKQQMAERSIDTTIQRLPKNIMIVSNTPQEKSMSCNKDCQSMASSSGSLNLTARKKRKMIEQYNEAIIQRHPKNMTIVSNRPEEKPKTTWSYKKDCQSMANSSGSLEVTSQKNRHMAEKFNVVFIQQMPKKMKIDSNRPQERNEIYEQKIETVEKVQEILTEEEYQENYEYFDEDKIENVTAEESSHYYEEAERHTSISSDISSEQKIKNNSVVVAPYNFWTNELTRDLLKCLQLYPMVWDKSRAGFYSSKNQFDEKIGRTLKVRPDWCRMRIDTLRKYFRELERKSEDQKSKISWPFYKDCQFMSKSAGPLIAQKKQQMAERSIDTTIQRLPKHMTIVSNRPRERNKIYEQKVETVEEVQEISTEEYCQENYEYFDGAKFEDIAAENREEIYEQQAELETDEISTKEEYQENLDYLDSATFEYFTEEGQNEQNVETVEEAQEISTEEYCQENYEYFDGAKFEDIAAEDREEIYEQQAELETDEISTKEEYQENFDYLDSATFEYITEVEGQNEQNGGTIQGTEDIENVAAEDSSDYYEEAATDTSSESTNDLE